MEFGKVTKKTYAKPIVTASHPPIIVNCKFKVDNGVIEAGAIVSLDANGEMVLYDGLLDVSGIVLEDIDTSIANMSAVLKHGVVNKEYITPNDSSSFDALASMGIY